MAGLSAGDASAAGGGGEGVKARAAPAAEGQQAATDPGEREAGTLQAALAAVSLLSSSPSAAASALAPLPPLEEYLKAEAPGFLLCRIQGIAPRVRARTSAAFPRPRYKRVALQCCDCTLHSGVGALSMCS